MSGWLRQRGNVLFVLAACCFGVGSGLGDEHRAVEWTLYSVAAVLFVGPVLISGIPAVRRLRAACSAVRPPWRPIAGSLLLVVAALIVATLLGALETVAVIAALSLATLAVLLLAWWVPPTRRFNA